MKENQINEKLASAVSEVERNHPELYTVLSSIAAEFSVAEIDPESGLAEPAAALVGAIDAARVIK